MGLRNCENVTVQFVAEKTQWSPQFQLTMGCIPLRYGRVKPIYIAWNNAASANSSNSFQMMKLALNTCSIPGSAKTTNAQSVSVKPSGIACNLSKPFLANGVAITFTQWWVQYLKRAGHHYSYGSMQFFYSQPRGMVFLPKNYSVSLV